MAAAAFAAAVAGDCLCKRRGCGKTFNPEDNPEGACRYHPGAPIFHEGLKGWSCCPKRFTDFTEFLAYPGCEVGRHTDELPADDNAVDANQALKDLASEQVDRLSLEQQKTKAQTRDSSAKVPLPLKVTASLEKALEQQKAKLAEAESQQVVQIGQACTRNACKGTYQGPDSDVEPCVHHPGEPVFHEGYKYWSCCPKKKTYEFDAFLEMPGCETSTHRWFRPLDETAKMKKCRHDWFQSGEHVALTIFAKCIDPARTRVMANTDAVTIEVVYETNSTYNLELHLAGTIDPTASTVQLNSTKMDIKLKKAVAEEWPALTAEEASSKAASHT